MHAEHDELCRKIKIYLATFLNQEEYLNWPVNSSLSDALDSIELFMFLIGLDKEFNRSIPDERFNLKEMGTISLIATVLQEIPVNSLQFLEFK